MPYLLSAVYLLGLLVLSPWLLYKAITTGKYRRGLRAKFFGMHIPVTPSPLHPFGSGAAPVAWFHGVSVGEIHLLRQVVARFRREHPHWECVISTTTDTGFDEARRRFPDLPVIFWPFDFSWAVHRTISSVNPTLVVLAEGELWPNFLIAARRRGVRVAVINGRMSPRSLRNYRLLSMLIRPLFKFIDLIAAQTEAYAENYAALGAGAESIHVTGSVKYDGVVTDRQNPQTQALRRLLNVQPKDVVWIAGSTQAPEEEMVLEIFQRARAEHDSLRLLLVPRQKERFEEVAHLLHRSGLMFLRRSELTAPVRDRNAVVLVDTIGELAALWGLADVAFVGGSLDGKRGGQNMIEPAAYGAAVVFGPHVWNFRDTAARLVECEGAIQVADAGMLEAVVKRLLSDPSERRRLGADAQQFVRSQQGATERTMECLNRLLGAAQYRETAA
jgi:3-deoxy-D-manno-octulosonic-acid transferase